MPIPATQFIWFNGKLVPWEKATVHVLSHALHYGSSVFEGLRAYADAAGPAIFACATTRGACLTRRRSTACTMPFSLDEINDACREVVAVNGLARGAYIRPVAFRGYGEIGVTPKNRAADGCRDRGVGVGQIPRARERGGRRRCVRVLLEPRRAEHLPALAKAGGNYLSSQLIGQEARRLGFAEGIGLAADGTVSEGSGENLFVVKDGVLMTPALVHSVLSGITRDTVMRLARARGIEVRECALPREFLYLADEAFFTGTAVEITPIDRRSAAGGRRASAARSRPRCRARSLGFSPDKPPMSGAGSTSSTCRRRGSPSCSRCRCHASAPRTMLEKIWEQHEVVPETADTPRCCISICTSFMR
jgi:branched-chain amino acid aminotransferase